MKRTGNLKRRESKNLPPEKLHEILSKIAAIHLWMINVLYYDNFYLHCHNIAVLSINQ